MSDKPLSNSENKTEKNVSVNPAAMTQVQFNVEGMTCQACATRIEKVLNKKPAIDVVSVNFAGETLNVSYDAEQTDIEQIVAWVDKTGFKAHMIRDTQPIDAEGDTSEIDWRLIFIWLCLMPFLAGMAGMVAGQGMNWMPPLWVQFILATVVQFGLAAPFYHSAWASIKGGLANMDVLVILGTYTIWLYSTFIWVQSTGVDLSNFWNNLADMANTHAHVHVYFEASVMIISFVKLGKFLEQRTKKHSLNTINLLLELTPTNVEKQVNTADADTPSYENVKLNDIRKGDVLRAKQGSRIATDGLVLSGEGWCNESHLTGESIPVVKRVGAEVLAGAMVDNGSITYRVTAIGSDTQLSDMVQALSEAQGSKAALARLADRVAAVFVPTVVVISLLTFVVTWWFTGITDKAMLHAVSVLVIACPCALGLATPAAIMAGMGVAAKHGIWFKDAPSLEAAGKIRTVIFDKTGTLTKGTPHIVDAMMVSKALNTQEVLQLAASVEAHTSHPLATALVNAAKDNDLKLLEATEVEVVAGQGVQAVIHGLGLVKVGTARFVGLKLPKLLPKVWEISSTIAVSADGVPLGMFALADELKEDSITAVNRLKKDGLQVVLLSGDKQSVVTHVANELGISNATGRMTPRDKSKWIEQYQAAGHKVAMVGDGINDAPAMATANASFSMLEGTDIAKHSASARLMGESVMQVREGVSIAQATVRNIKQNLFFAFIYNCLGIPLAAFGLLNPMIAAAAMALSSISVLANALRLTRYKAATPKTELPELIAEK